MRGGRTLLSQTNFGRKVRTLEINKTFCHFVARSPVFNAMFMHNMTENQEKKIDIEDLDIETVKDMLK